MNELDLEMRLPCAACGHAQALHCASPDHSCGCLVGMPDGPQCPCGDFERPESFGEPR
jgi:hypothetical protein